jgi:hypothetical protein
MRDMRETYDIATQSRRGGKVGRYFGSRKALSNAPALAMLRIEWGRRIGLGREHLGLPAHADA